MTPFDINEVDESSYLLFVCVYFLSSQTKVQTTALDYAEMCEKGKAKKSLSKKILCSFLIVAHSKPYLRERENREKE